MLPTYIYNYKQLRQDQLQLQSQNFKLQLIYTVSTLYHGIKLRLWLGCKPADKKM